MVYATKIAGGMRAVERLSVFVQRHDAIITLNLFIFGLCLIFLSRLQLLLPVVSLPLALYGLNPVTSMGCLFVAGAPVFYLSLFLRRREVDWFSIALFVFAAIVSLHYIHISNNTAYTNDWNAHFAHADYLSKNFLRPYGYSGWEEHHPPTYFYAAAIVIWCSNQLGNIDVLTAVRFVSWLSFLAFNLYGLLTLRTVGLTGAIYYVSAALLLLWPGSFHLASKISNEPMYYAFSAVTFYYTVLWYKGGMQSYLRWAVILAAISLTVRTNAILIFAVIGTLMMVALYRRRLSMKELFTGQWVMISILVLTCIMINVAKVVFYNYPLDQHLGYTANDVITLSHFLTINFDYTLKQPFNDWASNQTFWDFLLKSSIFGEYKWAAPNLAIMLNFLLVTMVIYSILPWFFARRAQWQGMMPYMLNLLIPLTFLLCFFLRLPRLYAQDARHIYPSLVCFVILFARSNVIYKERGWLAVVWLGPALAISFSLLSVYFFWNYAR